MHLSLFRIPMEKNNKLNRKMKVKRSAHTTLSQKLKLIFVSFVALFS